MIRSKFAELKNRQVLIRANGMDYRGILKEVTSEYVFIRRKTGYAQIPMEQVQSICDANTAAPKLKQVPEGYFDCGPESTKKKPD